ncbi:MAG TPA: YbaN family protein [Bacillota bacterium]|nr:YbaN family protein [Bacillota bacterium]
MKPGRAMRLVLLVSGTAALGMGVAGAFLPGVPTTPFLLIAAGCYARSSDRMYRWLLGHSRFGPPIKRLLAGEGLSLRAKVWSLAFAYAVLGLSAALWVEGPGARILLLALAALKTYYLLFRLPTAAGVAPPPERKRDPRIG